MRKTKKPCVLKSCWNLLKIRDKLYTLLKIRVWDLLMIIYEIIKNEKILNF